MDHVHKECDLTHVLPFASRCGCTPTASHHRIVRKFTQLPLLCLLLKVPPSPLSEDVLNGSPLTHNIAGSTNITGSTNGLVTQKICVDGWMVDVASDGRERDSLRAFSRDGGRGHLFARSCMNLISFFARLQFQAIHIHPLFLGPRLSFNSISR